MRGGGCSVMGEVVRVEDKEGEIVKVEGEAVRGVLVVRVEEEKEDIVMVEGEAVRAGGEHVGVAVRGVLVVRVEGQFCLVRV